MPISLATPMPLQEAITRLATKAPVASALRTADWSQLTVGLRDRAIFSAGVEDLRAISAMQAKLQEALDLSSRDKGQAFMDRSRFVAEMRQSLGAQPGDSGSLTDLTSTARLSLIYDFQKEDAMGYGDWLAGQDQAILDAFPAQELIRVEDRKVPREWAPRWIEAGGVFYAGRMIALKDDQIWEKLSRFGRPWPPYDFNSGMGLQDIERSEAIDLGVLQPGQKVKPQAEDFNARLEASLPPVTPGVLEGFTELFGNHVTVRDGKITWKGGRK